MNLSEHLDILGHDVNALAFRTKVDEAVIRRALQGLPITEQDAQRIAKYVGQRLGHDPHSDEDYKIDGLVKVSAPRTKAPCLCGQRGR